MLKSDTPTISDLERALDNLPSDVYTIYDGILERMPHKERDFAILKWMAYSMRPLLFRELGELALMGKDCTDFNTRNMLATGPAAYILRTFSSLVKVNGDLDADDASVQFAHYTVMDFLSDPRCRFYIDGCEANGFLASSCLSYLQFCAQSSGKHEKIFCQNCPIQRPLLEYSANSWYEHASKAYRDRRGVQRPLENSFWLPDISVLFWSLRFKLRYVLGIPGSMLTSLAWTIRSQNTRNNKQIHVSGPPKHSNGLISAWIESSKAFLRDESSCPSRHLYEDRLTEVACRGYEHVLRWLLDHGVLAKTTYSDFSLLEAALSERLSNLFEMLLGSPLTSHPANLWLKETRLEASIKLIVALLVDNGVDINARNSRKETPLHSVVGSGQGKAVRILLDINGINVDATDFLDNTPLTFAATHGHDEIVAWLLAAGADPSGTFGSNALERASEAGHYNCAELLINAGTDVNGPGSGGNTPLQSACRRGHESLVVLLIERGADVNAPAGCEGTALRAAVSSYNIAIIQLLLSKGAKIDDYGGHHGTA